MSDSAPVFGPAPPGGQGPAADEQPDPIQSRLARLEDALNSLRACFDDRLRYDAAKDRAFDFLYSKLREQDTDQGFALKKNLILALLRLHDHMENAEGALDRDSHGRQHIADLRTALLDILYAEDIEPITTAGAEFDRTRQQALGSVPASDPAWDNTVDRVVRAGFVCGDRVLRPQSVIVRRYQSPEGQEPGKGG